MNQLEDLIIDYIAFEEDYYRTVLEDYSPTEFAWCETIIRLDDGLDRIEVTWEDIDGCVQTSSIDIDILLLVNTDPKALRAYFDEKIEKDKAEVEIEAQKQRDKQLAEERAQYETLKKKFEAPNTSEIEP